MTNTKESMMEAARKKYGPDFGKRDYVAFDMEEARPAHKEDLADYTVIIDGEECGKTRVIDSIPGEAIKRNLGWMGGQISLFHENGSTGWVKFGAVLSVDKERRIINLITHEEDLHLTDEERQRARKLRQKILKWTETATDDQVIEFYRELLAEHIIEPPMPELSQEEIDRAMDALGLERPE